MTEWFNLKNPDLMLFPCQGVYFLNLWFDHRHYCFSWPNFVLYIWSTELKMWVHLFFGGNNAQTLPLSSCFTTPDPVAAHRSLILCGVPLATLRSSPCTPSSVSQSQLPLLEISRLKDIWTRIITEISSNQPSYESRTEAIAFGLTCKREVEFCLKAEGYNDFKWRSTGLIGCE